MTAFRFGKPLTRLLCKHSLRELPTAAVALLIGGCSATEPNPPAPPPEASGWIYFAESRRFHPPQEIVWRIRPDGTDRQQVPARSDAGGFAEFDISPTGRFLIYTGSGLVHVATESGGYFPLVFGWRSGPVRIAPDEKTVVSGRIANGDPRGAWQLWLTELSGADERLLIASSSGLRVLDWFPDGDSLIYVGVPQGYRVLRLHDLSTRALTPLGDWIAPSPSGRFGIDWNPDPIEHETKKYWRLYDLASGQIVAEATHRLGPFRVAWSPDERHFVDACHEVLPPNEPHSLCIYDRATLMPIRTLVSPTPETYVDYPRWIP